MRTGLSAAVQAGAVVIAYLDADLEYYPEDIPRLVEPILAGRADYVLGSRFRLRSAGDEAAQATRELRVHRAAGATDPTSHLRRADWDARLLERGGGSGGDNPRLQLRPGPHAGPGAQGVRMEEVPVRYRVREHGASFVKWTYPVKVLPAIWRELRSP